MVRDTFKVSSVEHNEVENKHLSIPTFGLCPLGTEHKLAEKGALGRKEFSLGKNCLVLSLACARIEFKIMSANFDPAPDAIVFRLPEVILVLLKVQSFFEVLVLNVVLPVKVGYR